MSIWIFPNELASFLSERVGYKSGIALSLEELAAYSGNAHSVVNALASTTALPIRLRGGDIEDAFQNILHGLGSIERPFVGHGPTILEVKYMNSHGIEQMDEVVMSHEFVPAFTWPHKRTGLKSTRFRQANYAP